MPGSGFDLDSSTDSSTADAFAGFIGRRVRVLIDPADGGTGRVREVVGVLAFVASDILGAEGLTLSFEGEHTLRFSPSHDRLRLTDYGPIVRR